MKIDVNKTASLANLTLTQDQETKFEKQLSDILNYVEKLNELDVKEVEPTSQVTGLTNVFHNDAYTDDMLTQEAALSGTKSTSNEFFKVKAILEEK